MRGRATPLIVGLGTDWVELSRIRALLRSHGERFKARLFTPSEIAYCDSHGARSVQHYAARFAAKEAAMKALGLGWRQGASWKEIEVTQDKNGQPHLHLSGATARTARRLKSKNIYLSLTHSKIHAAAIVILET